jgi:hypothetical protein
MQFERWAFAQALMDYFAHAAEKPATPAQVIEALGLDAKAYREAHAHHEKRILAGIAKHDLVFATQFADIFTRARAHVRATKPSLDDLRESTRLAAPLPPPPIAGGDAADETALLPVHVPNVIVPFGGPRPIEMKPAAQPPPAIAAQPPIRPPLAAPPVAPSSGADETVIAPAIRVPTAALPFEPSKPTDPKKAPR